MHVWPHGLLTFMASPDALDSLIAPSPRVEVGLQPQFPKAPKNSSMFPLFPFLLFSGQSEDHTPNKPKLRQQCCRDASLCSRPVAGRGGGLGALPPPGLASACLESLKTCLPDLASFTGLDASFLVGDGNQNQMLTIASGGSLLLPLLSRFSRVRLCATP